MSGPHAHPGGLTPSTLALGLVALALAAYLGAAWRERRRGRRWGGGRTAAFVGGAALLGAALSPPLAAWAHADLRGHAVQHVLIGMLVPLGLVLGAPITLVLRTLPVRAARRLAAVLKSRPVAVLSHPVTALGLNGGGMAVLYATPLYAAALASPPLHALVQAHVLAAGCLFTWAVLAGPDPAPHAPGMWLRLGVLFLATAAHATLGKLMYARLWPDGTGHAAAEVRAAAQLMYYGGDLAEGLLAVALFSLWYRARGGGRYSLRPLLP